MRYMAVLEYRGDGFHGFQKQPGVPTVQGALEEALSVYLGAPARTAGAGRTDAGVHALGQAVAFDSDERLEESRAAAGLSALMPEGVVVRSLRRVPGDFDPRRDAVWREYRYFILNRDRPSPVLEGLVHHVRVSLDREAVLRGCRLMEGEHDFSAFTLSSHQGSTLRVVDRCEFRDCRPELYCLRIRANSFLYRMVRIIAGALVSLGSGRMEPVDLESCLQSGEGPCADPLPAHGLYLWKVEYPPERLEP